MALIKIPLSFSVSFRLDVYLCCHHTTIRNIQVRVLIEQNFQFKLDCIITSPNTSSTNKQVVSSSRCRKTAQRQLDIYLHMMTYYDLRITEASDYKDQSHMHPLATVHHLSQILVQISTKTYQHTRQLNICN